MRESEFRFFLEKSPYQYSANSIRSIVSGAKRAEVVFATYLDEIVANDEIMFMSLCFIDIFESSSSYLERGLRKYYEFVNKNKFPSLLSAFGINGYMLRISKYKEECIHNYNNANHQSVNEVRRQKIISERNACNIEEVQIVNDNQIEIEREKERIQAEKKEHSKQEAALRKEEKRKLCEQSKIQKAIEKEKQRAREMALKEILDRKRKSMLISLKGDENGYITLKSGDYLDFFCSIDKFQWHIFGCKKDLIHSTGFFIPMVLLNQYRNSRIVWVTNFTKPINKYHYGQIWKEHITQDEETITREYLGDLTSLTDKEASPTDKLFIVIGVDNEFYKFYGLYEKNNSINESEQSRGIKYIQKYRKVSNDFKYKIFNYKLYDRY